MTTTTPTKKKQAPWATKAGGGIKALLKSASPKTEEIVFAETSFDYEGVDDDSESPRIVSPMSTPNNKFSRFFNRQQQQQ